MYCSLKTDAPPSDAPPAATDRRPQAQLGSVGANTDDNSQHSDIAQALILSPRTDELGRVNLDETPRAERFPEQRAHGALDSEDGLVGRRAEVDDAVVEAGVLVHAGVRGPLRLLFLGREKERKGTGPVAQRRCE